MENDKEKRNSLIRFSGLGFQMLGIVLVTAFAGNYIDKHWISSKYPIFTIILVLLGLASSMYVLIKELKDLN